MPNSRIFYKENMCSSNGLSGSKASRDVSKPAGSCRTVKSFVLVPFLLCAIIEALSLLEEKRAVYKKNYNVP